MTISLQDIAYFFVVTVILKVVIAGAIGDVLRRALRKWLIRNEHDLVMWLHYRNHAAHQRHIPRHPAHCDDDACAKLPK